MRNKGVLLVAALVMCVGQVAQAQVIGAVARRNSTNPQPVIAATPFAEDALVFVDRTHVYKEVPEFLVGAQYIMTSNVDRNVAGYELDVTLTRRATLYVLIDNRVGNGSSANPPALSATLMAWVADMGFQSTGEQVAADENADGSIDNYFTIYALPVAAGTITLGAQNDGTSRNMYTVAVVPVGVNVKARHPAPADGDTDVRRDVRLAWMPGELAAAHDVYLGTSLEDVNSASRANPLGVLISQGQDANAYEPTNLLEISRTYYWRVDEVNAPPDSGIAKGDVWSFTAEPLTYAVTGISASASVPASAPAGGPEKTIDGSGLDADGDHSIAESDMWLGDASGGEPVWIQYDFDRVYRLYDMHVWNYNSLFESLLGFGAKDVTIEYATEPNEWAVLGDFEFAKAPSALYPGMSIDLAGVAARSIRININSNWGNQTKFGLSEVQFSYIPVYARQPEPAAGATEVDPSVVLGWRAGREAVVHRVYFSADEDAVATGTALVDALADNNFDPGALSYGQTYYWRVDEVNDAAAPSLWQGDVWNFTTQEYLTVDDFEDYADDDGSRLFDIWIDGYEIATNGSVVGYENQPYAERTTVHSGSQSMPFSYDNTGTATYSEATRTFAGPQDWTKNGIERLTLYFYGDPNNSTTQRLYVRVDGVKVVYTGDAADIAAPIWTPWHIDLTSLGIDRKRVTQLTIGFERNDGAAGSGKVLIDDVRLYPPLPMHPEPEPFTGEWTYTYTGDAAAAGAGYTALDGTWSHDNGSDEWDGSAIGQGRPGGASALNGYLRIQDTGDPRDYSFPDPGSNRKIALAHSITTDITDAATRILDGVTISFRARIATGTPLDGIYPAGGAGTTPWPAGGDGYVTHDGGKGNFSIRQSDGDKIISFALALASDSDFLRGQSGLIMNSRNGTDPSGSVDVYDSEGKLNILELDPTVWHDYWITIQPDVTGSGTHLVRVYLDGSPVPDDFIVTAGDGNDYDDSYILIGAGATPQSGAFDVDYFSYKRGVFAPAGQP